ncbi:MAG: PAS domain S-box protein, partial [Thiobacillus sp.]|nr:PAS domain S-box protein [Thiobacillus sp.]
FALAAARDISSRKQTETALRASEERLRATLDNTPGVAVQWYDRAGHVLYWNKASEQLYGVPAAQAMGKTLRDLLYTPEQFSGFLDAIAGIEKRGMPYGPAEIDMQNRQGEKICVIYTLFQIPGNVNEPIFVCMDVDISERKRAEAELQLHREHLEELVRARTDEMDIANRELEAFSYSVSHDLRSPLRAVDGFALALTEDYAGKLDATGLDYLQRIRGGTQRMSALIDAMLQLSRIGRKPLKPGSLDLSAMAHEILAELAVAEPAHQVAIDITPGLGAWGDAQLLHAALANLLGNAWKYSAKTPHAKITFGLLQQDGQSVYFVRDNGVGFDMAHAGKLFGAFQRLHHRAEFEGTGIGLATVQ